MLSRYIQLLVLLPASLFSVLIIKVVSPNGWSFKPSSFPVNIDRETDWCSQGKDINFVFQGFSINGKVTCSRCCSCNTSLLNVPVTFRLLVMGDQVDQLV